MNSLRSRMILGFTVVAVVPLVVAMALLGQRIQSTVRAQAAERLGLTLAILQSQLRDDGEHVASKVEILSRDPQLKRLYLVPAGRAELGEYLAGQRFLLGLDYLAVTDSAGQPIAEGLRAPGVSLAGRDPLPAAALPHAAPGLSLARPAGSASLAFDASAPILYRDQPVGLVRAGTVLDSTRLAALARASGIELVLLDPQGSRVASTLAGAAAIPAQPGDSVTRVRVGGAWYVMRAAALDIGSRQSRSRLVGLASTATADETVAALRTTSILLGVAGLGTAILFGFLGSLPLSRPVERLAAFSERISRGEWEEPLAIESVRELRTLVEALERMRSDLRAYRDRLRAGERQAAYGQMARQVAHEIKNPLTPIAVSVADLRRSFELQRPEFPEILEQATRTITEEVDRLKRLLQEFSDFGRFPAPRLAPCDAAALLADLRSLYAGDGAAGRIEFAASPAGTRIEADAAQLRQALINLAQNALEATAPGGHVRVGLHADGAWIEFSISDDGPGIDPERQGQLFVPGFTTKTGGSGLGLAIVERIVSDHHGTISVESAPGRGTTFRIRLPLHHEA